MTYILCSVIHLLPCVCVCMLSISIAVEDHMCVTMINLLLYVMYQSIRLCRRWLRLITRISWACVEFVSSLYSQAKYIPLVQWGLEPTHWDQGLCALKPYLLSHQAGLFIHIGFDKMRFSKLVVVHH